MPSTHPCETSLIHTTRRRVLRATLAVVCIISSIARTSAATEWVSPIDTKYSTKNPELFKKVSRAHEIIDAWMGNPEGFDEAYQLLDAVIKSDPTFAPAYPEISRFLIVSGGRDRSLTFGSETIFSPEQALTKVIEMEPDYADAYVLLGHVYTNSRRFEDAKIALAKAEKIGTSIPWLPINRATLLVREKKYDEALELYQRVVDSNTRNRKALSAALDEIADVLRKMKQYPRANTAYQRAIAYEPRSAWKRGNYSEFLLYEFNEVDGAIKNARKALELMDYGVGRFALAAALYTKWAQLERDNADSVESQKYFREASALYPQVDQVIRRTEKYEYTKITAQALRKMKDRDAKKP